MVPAAISRACKGFALSLPLAVLLTSCAATTSPLAGPTRNQVIISVHDQKMTVVTADHGRVTFPISTSKFGLGDRRGSLATPTGQLEVAQKFGDGAAPGSVFHGRVRTGEIVKVDQPGRDAIVTRILALKGLEAGNKDAYSRGIYIHGTPEERNIGRPVSYGCIRMRSRDVIQLYDMVKVGARVEIIDEPLNKAIASNIVEPPLEPPKPNVSAAAVANLVASSGASVLPPSPLSIKPPPQGASLMASAGTPRPAGATPAVAAADAPAKKLWVKKKKERARKEWAGTPARLLAKQAALDARGKTAKPSDVSNPISNKADPSHDLGRNALDSL